MELIADTSHLLPPSSLSRLARQWLLEDSPQLDWAGAVVGERPVGATLLLKSPGVLAGSPFAQAVFREAGCRFRWLRRDGEDLKPVCTVACVWGPARTLLLAERAALNVLARASGVATSCRSAQELARSLGWSGRLAGTRKTTPGFRLVEKHAMAVGGVETHRYGLGDLLMLKDNHLVVVGDIAKAVREARMIASVYNKIEVESRSLEEARQAALAGADIVMLDNFTPQGVLEAARALKKEFPRLLIEASGGITQENLPLYLSPHVDVISLGSFTQQLTALDFSMKVLPELGSDPESGSSPAPDPSLGPSDFAF
ncbi:nicotinate-nucleotide pyrophosphorylase [carboxylating]-like [Pristis pectinata]|uniref:nicotinate-nucleotide pyrophosphorylase [carboxylating]-like n=1 Tax=Pristis pectinata TaxID=685728 RepID=UPI00223E2DFF|nr:nicotinate-nucleotide pyrophosphorylase [carboxylating]-like [Pristis pectinata]XP_051884880.1 nicotinate-nucleotide pyrophosphorylase [carboxylating]-like [Pristis pectinata]XP_051884882.1 nicotinate-nucleotide pyrophosphorylase [carboxylating]-like [Pristis pectinata]